MSAMHRSLQPAPFLHLVSTALSLFYLLLIDHSDLDFLVTTADPWYTCVVLLLHMHLMIM